MDKNPYKKLGIYLIFLGTIAGVMLLIIGLLASNAAASNIPTEFNSVLLK